MSSPRTHSPVVRPMVRELTEQECLLVAGGSGGSDFSTPGQSRTALPKGGFGSLAFEARRPGASALPKGGF